MLKQKPEKNIDENGGLSGQIEHLAEALRLIAVSQTESLERLEELETKKDLGGEARLLIAHRVFDTDRSHLREMTILPIRAVRAYSLADMSASILDPEVQCGKVTLGQVRRESVYRHLRSVKGNLLEKGTQLAMEQTRQAELEESQQLDLGG